MPQGGEGGLIISNILKSLKTAENSEWMWEYFITLSHVYHMTLYLQAPLDGTHTEYLSTAAIIRDTVVSLWSVCMYVCMYVYMYVCM